MKNLLQITTCLIAIMMFVGCDIATSVDKGSIDSDVADLEVITDSLLSEGRIWKDVTLISVYDDEMDSIVYETYAADTLMRLIRSFNFSQRERMSELEVEINNIKERKCRKWWGSEDSEIKYVEVCRKEGRPVILAGKKRIKSLLSQLDQSFMYSQESEAFSFAINSTFIDKVQKDTVKTTNFLLWTK